MARNQLTGYIDEASPEVNELMARITANPVGTETTRPQQWVSDASGQPFDPLIGNTGLTRSQWQQIGAAGREHMLTVLNFMGGIKFVPRVEAEKAMRALQKMGLNVERDISGLSRSNYLTATAPNSELDALKIRFSDHTLPSRYAQPAYDVGPHMEAQGSGWRDAVGKAARYFGVDAPKYARLPEAPTAMPVAAPAFSPIAKTQYDMLAAAFPHAGLVQGAPGSAVLARTLAAQYEAANPGAVTWIMSLDPKLPK